MFDCTQKDKTLQRQNSQQSQLSHPIHLTSIPSLQQKNWHVIFYFTASFSQSKTEAHLLSLDYIYLITCEIMKTSLKNSAKNCNTSDIFSSRISHIPIACENNP
jgi:hypothetical protein